MQNKPNRFDEYIRLENPCSWEVLQIVLEELHSMRESAGVAEEDVETTVGVMPVAPLEDALVIRMREAN